MMSFGIETVAPCQREGLHFWFDEDLVPQGVAWLFPIGEKARIGVGSYKGDPHLKAYLDIFLSKMGLQKTDVHGGYFPAALREPTVGRVFLVGDAAGQCLPLTGEGIRPAIYFGQVCGAIVQRVIEGKISLEEGLRQYRAIVFRYSRFYRFLGFLQRLLLSVPAFMVNRLIALVSREPFRSYILRGYEAFANPKEPEATEL